MKPADDYRAARRNTGRGARAKALKAAREATGMSEAFRLPCLDALPTAIAKARSWIDDIRPGHLASFPEIAERESQGERHIRLLAPLAAEPSGLLGVLKDSFAAGHALIEGRSGPNELVKAIEAEFETSEGRTFAKPRSWLMPFAKPNTNSPSISAAPRSRNGGSQLARARPVLTASRAASSPRFLTTAASPPRVAVNNAKLSNSPVTPRSSARSQ